MRRRFHDDEVSSCRRRTRASSSDAGASSLALVLSPEAKEYYREVRTDDDDIDLNLLNAAPSDFFELLGIDITVPANEASDESQSASASSPISPANVKKQFRRLQRVAHPDIAGPVAEPLAVLLNAAYATLSDEGMARAYRDSVRLARKAFSGGSQFDGRPVSQWLGNDTETRAIFVDESTCIGCKSCVLHAPGTFDMVEDFNAGRARCTRQWGDDEETIQVAIELCPVDCIYWIKRQQLALLEYAMKGCKREDIAIMARRRSGNMGSPPSGQSPFSSAENMLKLRREGRRFVDEAAAAAGAKGGGYGGHDEKLAGAIASAWLSLPRDIRAKGWPEWEAGGDEEEEEEEKEDAGE